MTRTTGRAIACLSLLGTAAFSADAPPTIGRAIDEVVARPASYRLVWSDEFDRGAAPDPAKWRFDTERNKAGWL